MSYSILDDLPKNVRPQRAGKAGKEELRTRLAAAVDHLLDLASQQAVSRALEAASAFDSLSLLLDRLLQEHPEVAMLDRGLDSRVRLLESRRDLLERAGGTYETAEAAEILDITSEAVRKRVQRGTLLAYRTSSGEYRFPRAQFSDSGTVGGLAEVLRAMQISEPWMRIQLFLDRDVAGALEQGRIDDAVRAVSSYMPMDEGWE